MANAGLIAWISVLTFNIWGLPDIGFQILSPLREERVEAICEALRKAYDNKTGWDVVLLQEVWVLKDRERLLKCGYPYAVDLENRGIPIDSGLLTLSRHPVQESDRLTYSAGSERALDDGENLARKSATIARISHPQRGDFWVANTHLVARYDEKNDVYHGRRQNQFRAFADWVKRKAGKDPLIVGGDFNILPTDDLWKNVKEQFKGFVEAPEAEKACTICPPNTLHSINEGKVDHLLASPSFVAGKGAVALDQPLEIETEKISLSDHFGWATVFGLSPQPPLP